MIVRFAAILVLVGPVPAAAQSYTPGRTEWGDPDLAGVWTYQQLADANIPFERDEEEGDRAFRSDAGFAEVLELARKTDVQSGPVRALEGGSDGLVEWLARSPDARRNSLIVDPANGRLPALTDWAEALAKAARSSWFEQEIDWVSDLDTYDRCISLGMPNAMMPILYNSALQLFQAPGFVVLQTEVSGARIIPLGAEGHPPEAIREWLGDSRGRWDGDVLVIETTNLVTGDSATYDLSHKAPPPTYLTDRYAPVSPAARVVERIERTGPAAIAYSMTYSDPEVFAAPWTVAFQWDRSDSYALYEYACHEGNSQVRHLINSSRAQRKLDAAAAAGKE